MHKSFGTAFVRLMRRSAAALGLTSRYRPELHYMRGPGPKSGGERKLRPGMVATAKANSSNVKVVALPKE